MRIPRMVLAVSAGLLCVPMTSTAAQQSRPLASLSFMAGCWRGDAGVDSTIEENWTGASSDVMLATTRYLDDNTGRTRMWEFSRVVADSGQIVLLPAPRGVQAGRFRLTGDTPGEARFEDPAHDSPKRIIYRRVDANRMTVQVDDGPDDRERIEFRFVRVACPGPAAR